jgi:hypothetical protein
MKVKVKVRKATAPPEGKDAPSGGKRRKDGTFIGGDNPYAFKKGQSGNPSGRPKVAHLSTAYKRKLAEVCPHDPEGRTWAEVISEGMCIAALNGKAIAAKEIRQATEGDLLRTSIDWKQMLTDMGVDPEQAMKDMVEYIGGTHTS